MAPPASGPASDDQSPTILLAITITLLACCTDHCLAQGRFTPHDFAMPSNLLPVHNMLSQGSHCHPTAAATRGTNKGLHNATSRAALTLLGLQPCCFWAHHTTQYWWLYLIQQTWDNKQWLDGFHMNQATFQDLLQQLWPHLEHQDTDICPALPTNIRLALMMLKLATSASLWYAGYLFSMGKTTIGKAILVMGGALQDVLRHTLLCIHDPLAVAVGFCALGFPQCTGALDQTHIRVTCPPHGDHPYYSHMGFHCMVLKAVTDHQGTFTHASTSYMGSVHNAHEFWKTSLAGLAESRCFMPGVPDLKLGAIMVLPLLIGGPAYPRLPWLIRLYNGQQTGTLGHGPAEL